MKKTLTPLLVKIYQSGLNQKQLAEKAKINNGYLSLIVTGQTRPNKTHLKKIAKVLHCEPQDIFFE